MSLLEVLVSLAVLAMISLLIYGAFDSLNRGKRAEATRTDRARQGRESVLRMTREFAAAYLSMHIPYVTALITGKAVFIGRPGATFDRVDFASFSHRRIDRDAKESDQCEIGYFVVSDPENSEKKDLVRREQTPIDLDPERGGVINVLAEDIEALNFRYLDSMTGMWVERWDTTQMSGQPNRLPLQVRITLVMKGVTNAPSTTYTTKTPIFIQQPLSFGILQ